MTDKWIIENGKIKDTTTNMTFDSFVEIITVLNGQSRRITELASDNKRLKFQLNDCLNKKLFSRRELEKENKQLKETNQKLNEEVCILQMDLCKTKSYEQLEKENKRLKQKIKDIVTTDAKDYNKLYEENEQCKMMIATLRNIILENGIDVE